MSNKHIKWTELALMAFVSVWGFGNVVNNFAQQGLTVVFSWIFIMALYFIPYALMVGELGAVYKDGKSGVSSWIKNARWHKELRGARLAYLAGWTYWVVHVPYLAQKPQAVIVALGWALRGDGALTTMFDTKILQLLCLAIFLGFMTLASRGITSLKRIGSIAGLSMFVMSLLYVLLAIAAPAIRDVPVATQNINIKAFIPKFDFTYLTTLSMLVFAVGGAEKMSPYVNNVKDGAKDFPRAMIALAAMVALSAITGSIAMGFMFDAANRPADLMMNGAYYSFQKLGEYYGLGNFFLIVYALANAAGQISALLFSIDAPLKVMLLDADERYVPKALTKVNKFGAPINGYILTAILVGILIIIPAMGIGSMNDLYNWLLNLNSIVMPMRYLWVFFAYIVLRSALNEAKNNHEHYKFIKNRHISRIFGYWCFLFTAFVCILGIFPKGITAGTAEYNFQFALNIFAPVILIVLGLIMPIIARLTKRA